MKTTLYKVYSDIQKTSRDINLAEMRCRLNMNRKDCVSYLKELEKKRDKQIKTFETYLRSSVVELPDD